MTLLSGYKIQGLIVETQMRHLDELLRILTFLPSYTTMVRGRKIVVKLPVSEKG